MGKPRAAAEQGLVGADVELQRVVPPQGPGRESRDRQSHKRAAAGEQLCPGLWHFCTVTSTGVGCPCSGVPFEDICVANSLGETERLSLE